MNPGGWFEERGKAAADALIRRGYKGLAVLVARICASYPWDCILTYDKIAEAIANWYGRKPHRESIGRVARLLARQGLLTSHRVMPGQPLPGLGFLSAHGTTAKDFPFRRLGERDPIPQNHRRRVRRELRARHRPAAVEYTQVPESAIAGPKYSSTVTRIRTGHEKAPKHRRESRTTYVDPDLQKMFDAGNSYFDAKEAAEDAEMYASVKRLRSPP